MEDATNRPDSLQPVRTFDWHDYLPWLIIVKALRPATSFRLLILAAAGLVAMTAGWRISWDLLAESEETASGFLAVGEPADTVESAQDPDPQAEKKAVVDRHTKPAWPWIEQSELRPPAPTTHELRQNLGKVERRVLQPLVPFVLLFDGALTWTGLAYVLLCGAWTLIVWSFFGAMITRVAALRLTIDEHASWGRMSAYARSRWNSYFAAPLFPLAGVVTAAIPIAVLGFLARSDVTTIVTGLLWPLAIVAGLFMALLLVGLMLGWPLMYATISTEGTDSFDALGRSYAYVYQRPLHYLFYIVVALVCGGIGLFIVELFAYLVIHTTEWAASWFLPSDRAGDLLNGELDTGLGYVGSSLILFWKNIVFAIVAGFPLAYMWCAATAIYLLLRRQVDAAEMDEVELDDDDDRNGLPPLASEPTGGVGTANESDATAVTETPASPDE
ncbi:MAG: hypothetical protein VB875_15835 [Pirellulales bacterium]